MLNKTISIAISAIIMPVFLVGVAFSQALERQGIEEIIVTAQKTEQNIQDVPIAVTAFNTESLELQQIETFSDLQFNAPNITFTKGNFAGSNFVIRGVNSYTVAASGDGGVAFHINEVPVATRIFETEYYDLERVEILRGPQGTLYGANSVGGTVNMMFASPTDEAESSVEVEVGDYGHRKFKAMVNMPLADGLALRVAGLSLQRDGFSDNLFPGRETDVDGRDITSWRFTLQAELSENTTAKFTYWNFEEDDNRARIGRQMCKATEVPSFGCHPTEIGYEGPAGTSTFGGDVAAIAGLMTWSPMDYMGKTVRSTDPRATYQNMNPVYKASEDGYLLSVESNAFENITIRANLLYHETSVFSQQDYNNNDGSAKFATYNPNNTNPLVAGGNAAFPQGIVPVSQYTPSACGVFCGAIQGYYDYAFAYDTSMGGAESKYVDISVQSSFDGPVNFIAGLNVSEYESAGVYDVYFSSADAAAIAPILAGLKLYPSHYRNETNPYELERKGLFAEVYYQATDDLKVTVGARWNESEKSVADRQLLFNSAILGGGTGPGDPVTLAVQTGDPKFVPILIGLAAPPGALEPIPGLAEQRRLQGVSSSFSEKEVTGKIGIDWTPDLEGTDSTLVYFTYSRGYRPGAFNPPVDPNLFAGVAQTTDPEFIDAFELGMKNVLLDNTLIANLTAFYYDYQDLQVSKIIARTSVNENIDAEMQGLEAELFWSPSSVPGLRIDAQVSFLETEVANNTYSLNPLDKIGRNLGDTSGWLVKDFGNGATCGFKKASILGGIATGVLNINPAAGALDMIAAAKTMSVNNIDSADPSGTVGAVAQIFGMGALPTLGNCAVMNTKLTAAGLGGFYEPEYDISGNELVQAPAITAHLGIEYTADLSQSDLMITSRIDYYWQDDFWTRLYNVPRDVVDAWDVINAQIIFQSTSAPWYIRIWGQNLADDDNITGHYFTAEASGGFRNDFLLDPRMIGVTFGAKF